MSSDMESLKPIEGAQRTLRQRLTLRGELTLALMPTLVVLVVFALVDVLSQQRLLFASLAASAFLIYVDPEHGINSMRTLIAAHLLAAVIGFISFRLLGAGYLAGGVSMVLTIILIILLDVVHPPAIATSLAFSWRSGQERDLVIFILAVAITTLLVILQRMAVWILAHYGHRWGKARRH